MSHSRQLLMVVGPDRRGASVLTNVLGQLGYSIPQPEIAADRTSPAGFGESAWLVDFHCELMEAGEVHDFDARPAAFADALATIEANTDYRDRATEWLATSFADVDHVVLSEPRLLWFTTLWEQAAAEHGVDVTYVTTLRHPSHAVAGNQQWYESNQTATHRLAAWMNGMLYTERATRGHARGFVEFDSMLTDWVGAVTTLDAQADLPPVRQALTRHYRVADELVDPSLRCPGATWDDLDLVIPMRDLAERIWHEVRVLAPAEGPPCRRDAELDDLRAEYVAMYEWAEAMTQSTAIASRRVGLREGRRLERRERRERRARTEASTATTARPVSTEAIEPSVSSRPADASPADASNAATDAVDRLRRRAVRAVGVMRRRSNAWRRTSDP